MSEVILNMLLSGKMMVEKSLLSFVNSDTDYAIWTIKNDSIVDDMNQKLLKNSISKARMSAKTKEMLLSYADLKNIITNIERIADHATNIAEATIYSLQGTDIRHSGIDKDPDTNANKEIEPKSRLWKSKEKNILIVDDEEDLCEILQFNLNNSGFNTDVAHSSEETLKKPLYDYDLFLLDVMMGNMSGFRLAEKLRKEYRITVR